MLALRYGDLEDGAGAPASVRVLVCEHDDVEDGDARDEARGLRCGAETRAPANDHHYPARRLTIAPAPASTLYEEFHPFGTTSYAASNSGLAASAKRYRYLGRERDEESGFYHLGARYYASWLGRWTAADPAGLADGPGRYTYSRCNPIVLSDRTGLWAEGPAPRSYSGPRSVFQEQNEVIGETRSSGMAASSQSGLVPPAPPDSAEWANPAPAGFSTRVRSLTGPLRRDRLDREEDSQQTKRETRRANARVALGISRRLLPSEIRSIKEFLPPDFDFKSITIELLTPREKRRIEKSARLRYVGATEEHGRIRVGPLHLEGGDASQPVTDTPLLVHEVFHVVQKRRGVNPISESDELRRKGMSREKFQGPATYDYPLTLRGHALLNYFRTTTLEKQAAIMDDAARATIEQRRVIPGEIEPGSSVEAAATEAARLLDEVSKFQQVLKYVRSL